MTETVIKRSDGTEFTLPLFDPFLSEHLSKPSSNVPTLLHEINERQIYADMFAERGNLTFVDIGANIGLVSIYASSACDRILAVEPDPATFKVLKAATYPLPQIECFNAALCPKDGPCEFFENYENTTASSTVNTFGNKIMVPGLTLSSILRINQLEHVDVVKVDCEGAEELSLNAYELQMATPVVDRWYIETHNTPTSRWQDVMERLSLTLKYLGYTGQERTGMRLEACK